MEKSESHVVIFPLPLQGHIKPLLCLAELLCHAGLHVTFVHTHHSQKLMANLHALSTHFPTLHFDSISDGLPEDDPREVTNAFLMALTTSIKPHFRDLLHSLSSIKLADDGRRLPPPSCVITDGLLFPCALDVAEDLGLPILSYNVAYARYLWTCLCLPKLIEQCQIPFQVFVNGKFCKDPKLATADDFFFSGLQIPRNTSNPVGSNVTQANVQQIPGLNTLGISLARIDYAPYGGLNPPHIHPRASEILVVLEGTLYVGFVTSNPDNRLFTKVLNKGDVFVFPIGLIHFQFNIGHDNAVAIAGLSSQNPGVITIANAVFGSNPPINLDVLTKAFQIDNNVVQYLQKQFWYDNN